MYLFVNGRYRISSGFPWSKIFHLFLRSGESEGLAFLASEIFSFSKKVGEKSGNCILDYNFV